jgi:FkbM family methyltransferase
MWKQLLPLHSRFRQFVRYSFSDFLAHPLSKRRPLGPWVRFIKLQLMFLLGYKRVVLPWIDPLVLRLSKGDTGLANNFYLGMHEFEDMAFAIHGLRQGELFLDIGANLGSYSLLVSGLASVKSIAFEPVPASYSKLVDNIEINSLGHLVEPRQLALSGQSSRETGNRLMFSLDQGCSNSFVGPEYSGLTTSVEVSTLDEQCRDLDPVLLKIDVEGFEFEVLQGAYQILRKESILAVIIEGQTAPVNQCLEQAGFVDVNYFPLERQIRPHAHWTPNRIWIKKEKLASLQQRLDTAPRRRVYGNSF